MHLHRQTLATVLAALGALCSIDARASCGSAYCSLTTDLAAEAAGVADGASFDLRYEHIRQDQPRAGSRRIGAGEIPHHHDEVSTLNRNLIGTYSQSFGGGWGLSVVLPFVDRDHLHVHNHHGAQLPGEWNFRELGDVRVTGRHARLLAGSTDAPRTVGFVAGLKLPTGRTGIANGEGEAAERSLQPGTGTTDLVLGAFFHQQLAQQGGSWFAQVQAQRALNSHHDYRPGAQLAIDIGYAKSFTDKLSGIVQLNAVFKGRDSGGEAEPEDSGGRSLFLSPGLSYQFTDALRGYAYYQQPLYQYVHGVQLAANRAFVVGVSTRF